MIVKLITMICLGVIGIGVAIPFGLTMKLNPVLISLSTALGAIIGLLFILLMGKPVRRWYMERYKITAGTSDNTFIFRCWKRYGTIGYGLLAPLVLGTHIGALLGIILGVPTRSLLVWLSVGTFLWCIVFTFIGTIGLVGIEFFV